MHGFSTKGAGQLDIHIQKLTLDPHFIPYSKINSKWVIDINVRAKTVKRLEDNMKENPWDLKQWFDRYNTKSMVHKRKIIDKLYFM